MYCGKQVAPPVAVTPPGPPLPVVLPPPPRMMGAVAPPIHLPPMMGMPPIRRDPLPPPLPPDPFTQNREWATIFQAAGFSEPQLQFPPVHKAFLITDLGNLRTRIDRNLAKLRCHSGHSLSAKSPAQLTHENPGYSSGFRCDLCSVTYPATKKSMHCSICQFDMCDKCGLARMEG
ncbi:hypothetical protein Pelo_8867 [Pelomyxa schiedti]|nr:hypothetical protein Pelo_8867 [Pelomyxa schiedti]